MQKCLGRKDLQHNQLVDHLRVVGDPSGQKEGGAAPEGSRAGQLGLSGWVQDS